MTKKEKVKVSEVLAVLNIGIEQARQGEDRVRSLYKKGGPYYLIDLLPEHKEELTGATKERQALEKAKILFIAAFPKVCKEVIGEGI